MRKSTFIKSMLLLCALIVGSSSAWAGDITATLTGTNMLEGSSPSTSYTNHSVTDNKGFTYSGKWTYQKNGSDYMNMIQIKKTESSNSSRIQLPTFDGPIKSITILATASDQTSSSGTGAKTTLLIVKGTTYSTSYANNAANQVLTAGSSGTTTNTYSFDFTTLNDDYDGTAKPYIYCKLESPIDIMQFRVLLAYKSTEYKEKAIFERKLISQEIDAEFEYLESVEFNSLYKQYYHVVVDPAPGYIYRLRWKK